MLGVFSFPAGAHARRRYGKAGGTWAWGGGRGAEVCGVWGRGATCEQRCGVEAQQSRRAKIINQQRRRARVQQAIRGGCGGAEGRAAWRGARGHGLK